MAKGLHEDEPLPERTTPQGTQAEGVEHGHEARDIDYRALTKWFGGLAISVAITFAAVLWGWHAVLSFLESRNQPPSPILTERWDPPLPRVLPNRVDSPPGRIHTLPQPMLGPAEYLVDERAIEARKLDKLGLRDPATGLPRLPPDAVQKVLADVAARPARFRSQGPVGGLQHLIPSGASGGLRLENKLR